MYNRGIRNLGEKIAGSEMMANANERGSKREKKKGNEWSGGGGRDMCVYSYMDSFWTRTNGVVMMSRCIRVFVSLRIFGDYPEAHDDITMGCV